jgi:penicillin-binding protein 2
MVPRRNPEIVIAVLQEHGDWGALSAHIAAQIITTYVNKKRSADHNVLDQASLSKPVEVGAVWTTPAPPGRKRTGPPGQVSVLHAGHFMVSPGPIATPNASASAQIPLPALLLVSPLRIKQELP